MTITGKIEKIFDEEWKGERFNVRNFVIKLPQEQHAPYVKLQLVRDGCSAFERMGIDEGDNVKVEFNVGGRRYIDKNSGNERFFNILTATNIELTK